MEVGSTLGTWSRYLEPEARQLEKLVDRLGSAVLCLLGMGSVMIETPVTAIAGWRSGSAVGS